jgi:hypothetical protein
MLSVLAFAAAGIIGIAAIADHANKHARMDRAEVSEWYCRHRGVRCNGPSSRRIEDHWNQRQLVYEVLVAILVTGSVLRAAAVLPRKRK